MKKLLLASLMFFCVFGALQTGTPNAGAANVDCTAVLCPTCPEGTVLDPAGNNCCRCKKDNFPKQCIAVLCQVCPEGTVPDPRPNDCCRCVTQS
jgi:hypothetical protein